MQCSLKGGAQTEYTQSVEEFHDSLVSRLFLPPVFDCLQYAKTASDQKVWQEWPENEASSMTQVNCNCVIITMVDYRRSKLPSVLPK